MGMVRQSWRRKELCATHIRVVLHHIVMFPHAGTHAWCEARSMFMHNAHAHNVVLGDRTCSSREKVWLHPPRHNYRKQRNTTLGALGQEQAPEGHTTNQQRLNAVDAGDVISACDRRDLLSTLWKKIKWKIEALHPPSRSSLLSGSNQANPRVAAKATLSIKRPHRTGTASKPKRFRKWHT